MDDLEKEGFAGIYGLIIPTLDAGGWLNDLLPALAEQSIQPARTIIMDSASSDETVERFESAGAEVVHVPRNEFDHGGTRQRAIDMLEGIPFAILLTQDAIPASPAAFETLLRSFNDPSVAVSYGRQLPRRHSGLIEAHARLFNYSSEGRRDSMATVAESGIRASFCSNSFSAYRIAALQQVGGLPDNCIFGEDAVVAMRLLQGGWDKIYVPSAQVLHSHSYSVHEDFKRAFDIGVLHATAPEMQVVVKSSGGEGLKFVISEQRYLLSKNPFLAPVAALRTLVKYVGYNLGRRYKYLHPRAVRMLSLNRKFWLRSDMAMGRADG